MQGDEYFVKSSKIRITCGTLQSNSRMERKGEERDICNKVTSARALFFPLNPSLCKGRALLICLSLSCLTATDTPPVTGPKPRPAVATPL